jgi:AraC-like DNA-binding protein
MTQHSMPGAYVLYTVELAKRWNVTADVLLAGTGLKADALADPWTRVPIATLTTVLERARTLTREPAFGFYLGLQMRISAYGLVGVAALSAPTMREAIELTTQFVPIVTTAVEMRLQVDGRDAALIVEERADFGLARDTILLATLIGLWQIGQALSGRDLMGFADLVLAEPDYYSRLLLIGPRVRFNQPANRLLFDASILELPYAMADPVGLRLAREQCERVLGSLGLDDPVTTRVRGLLSNGQEKVPTLAAVAKALRLSPRTLKRQLAAEKTSFSLLVDEERRQRALYLLSSPGLSLKDIADRLGYANIANFSRAFQRWTGERPGEHRHVGVANRRK